MSLPSEVLFIRLIANLDRYPNAVDGLDAQSLKEYWDENPEILRIAINAVTTGLANITESDNGARTIGCYAYDDLTKTNLYELVIEVYENIKANFLALTGGTLSGDINIESDSIGELKLFIEVPVGTDSDPKLQISTKEDIFEGIIQHTALEIMIDSSNNNHFYIGNEEKWLDENYHLRGGTIGLNWSPSDPSSTLKIGGNVIFNEVNLPDFDSDIDGVVIETPLDDDVLTYDSGDWVNKSASAHTHSASDVLDFDTEVANNSAVAANTSKVTYDDAATVSQSVSDINNIEVKTDHISVTQTVNLDTMESNINTNNAKVTYDDAAAVAANTAKVTYDDAATVSQSVSDINNIEVKTDHISVTQAVNLDTMESNINTNNAKVTYDDAAAVTLNTAKVTYDDAAAVSANTAHKNIVTGNPHAISIADLGDATAANIPVVDTNDYYLGSQVEEILNAIGENRRWNGFDSENPTTMGELSWVDGTRTLTIDVQGGESEFIFWCGGKKFTKTTAQSIVIPDVTESYFVYFDISGVLQYILVSATTKVIFEEDSFVVQIIWNSVSQGAFVGEERHGTRMDGATHYALHDGIGALYHHGMDITGLADSSPTYTNTTSGEFADEDINHIIALQATHSFIYKLGADGIWTGTAPDNNVAHIEGGDTYASWNEWTGTTWQLTEGGVQTDYFITFFMSSPDINEPLIYKIIGQNAYSSVSNARNAIDSEATSLSLDELGAVEMVLLYAIIVDRTGDLQTLDDGSLYFDLRKVRGGLGNTAGTTTIAADVVTLIANFDGNLSASDTNVQLALETLDDMPVGGASELAELSDVDSTVGSPSDGNIMVYRNAGTDWILEAKPEAGSNPALNDVTDVVISATADNEVLAYDNGTSKWINQTLAEIGAAAASHTHSASQVTDFDTEVANNSAVAANTSKVTYDDAATVSQSVSDINDIEVKTDFITITQAVNLDTMESNINTNNAKVTYDDAAAVTLNTAKVTYDDAAAVAANTAKVTYDDAAAVTLNTAKVTYDDAAAVSANTAKVTYDAQSAVAANTAKVTYDAQSAVAANTSKVTYDAQSAVAANTAKVTYDDAAIVAALEAKGSVKTETGSSTLGLADANDFLYCTNGSAITITVPPNSSVAFPIGTELAFYASGAGTVTLAAGGGVTLKNKNGLVSNGQNSSFAIKKVLTDIWIVSGDLTT